MKLRNARRDETCPALSIIFNRYGGLRQLAEAYLAWQLYIVPANDNDGGDESEMKVVASQICFRAGSESHSYPLLLCTIINSAYLVKHSITRQRRCALMCGQ